MFDWIRKLTVLEWLVIGAVLLIAALILCGCHGGPKVPSVLTPGGGDMVHLSGAESSVVAAYRTNWALSVAVIGVTASVFAICMGLRKLGAAGLCSSFTMAAMSVAMIRYAWIFGIGGLLVGIVTGLAALVKNRQTIFGFVDGFQETKDKFFPDKEIFSPNGNRACVNKTMSSHLNPIAERMVKARKKALAKPEEIAFVHGDKC